MNLVNPLPTHTISHKSIKFIKPIVESDDYQRVAHSVTVPTPSPTKQLSSDTENNAMEISLEEDKVIEDFMDFLMIAFMHDHINASSSRRPQRTCPFKGSAYDNAILVDSIIRADLQFPHPPNGKYYLVDIGFTNMPGFLVPFRSQRYHLQEFHGRHYSGPKELFNHRHSSLCNVIERTFGVLKKRFPILRYSPFFMETDNEKIAAEAEADGLVGDQANYVDMSQHGLTYQSNFRDAIATAMWQNHVGHG
ncbi:hypothetical protein ACSBR2_022835 [Camellia fascicularis]